MNEALIELQAKIVDDGQVALEWRGGFQSYWLLAIRSGAKPGFTTLKLDGGTRKYRFANLGRHQRYRFAVLAARDGRQVCSRWLSATPRAGLAIAEDVDDLAPHLARLERIVVMPQDRRLTLYWQLGVGFVDKVIVELRRDANVLATFELEPEVRSFTIDHARCRALANGATYTLTARPRFALTDGAARTVTCTPAPQGEERDANRAHPQEHLVYACLSLAPELDVFGDGASDEASVILCGRCRGATEWRDYTLRCTSCRAEFIANLRGDYLDVTKLRFGTCRCCLPRKLLVQDVGSESLRCSHSGKEHLRGVGREASFLLIEDLPFGLCQCCRPRRPLANVADEVRCTKSNELHRRSGDQLVLVPSAPVFDAAVIDELLDAGLADICASGVSRGGRRS